MIKSILTYWTMTQLVKEDINIQGVRDFMRAHFSADWCYSIFKTSKDEVLQIYNDSVCYTVIGGSSGDKWEWKSNFNWLPLVDGYMHQGFHRLAMEVVDHGDFIRRNTMVFACHSRGAGACSILAHKYNWVCIGFGSPKSFRKSVECSTYYNVRNPLDPVCHVVPFFRTAGNVIKYKFASHPHTGYGKHIKRGDTID